MMGGKLAILFSRRKFGYDAIRDLKNPVGNLDKGGLVTDGQYGQLFT